MKKKKIIIMFLVTLMVSLYTEKLQVSSYGRFKYNFGNWV